MARHNKFGTFGGVFVPSILTILGVIMYLRLPMIVGEAGLWSTLGIILVAHIISVTTGLSVSSIATDKKVEAGGTYYMISRSLGLPIGGTLGLSLFVGLSFSVSLYLIGFSESFLNYWGFSPEVNNIRITGTIVLLIVTTVTFISTSLAIKTQYFIMAAILLSLLSIFLGDHEFKPAAPLFTNPGSAIPLMVLFGIFFPAVTGFEAGVSMSGDLKDPKKSIPYGSIAAIVVGFVVYVGLAFYFSFTVDKDSLANDPNVLLNIAWFPELVIAGIWGATLSSALGSILGAPRILQATAADKITPRIFSIGHGPTNEPRNALLLTFVIAEAGILIGELDVIARVVSIFFITTYGFLNISATFEKWTSADFRPEFKVPGWVSLLGATACILVMIQLDFIAMIGAIVILGLLFLFLKRKQLTLDSGDAWSGVWASLVKTGITYLKKDKLHQRNWRPNIIMFSGRAEERTYMVEMGKAISGNLGILSAFDLSPSEHRLLNKSISHLQKEKDAYGYFHHKLECRDAYAGMDHIARVYGFSGVEPNTILMGWSKKEARKEKFVGALEKFIHYQYNLILLDYDAEKKYGNHSTIDIWWSGHDRNLDFAINLIRHISGSELWSTMKTRLLIINPFKEEDQQIYEATGRIIDGYRVDMTIKVINNHLEANTQSEIIMSESKDSDLIILGITDQQITQFQNHYDQIHRMLKGIGSALIINASRNFEEYEVISNAKSKMESLTHDEFISQMRLPDLQDSHHPEIAEDIRKIDINGRKVLEIFYKKTIHPIIVANLNILQQFTGQIRQIGKDLEKIESFPDVFRKKRAIEKIKNDFLFKINELFSKEIKDERLAQQLININEGLGWYQERLKEDFKKFPKTLKVSYSKEELQGKAGTSFWHKMNLGTKISLNRFFNKPITQKINYREIARYFQLHSRQEFIQNYLKQFDTEEGQFILELGKITNTIISFLDQSELQLEQAETHWNKQNEFNEILAKVDNIYGEQIQYLKLYDGRLLLEFRKNLQLMSDEMNKIDINAIIKKKIKSAKYYKQIQEETLNFPEEYGHKISTLLNRVLMDISIKTTKNRMQAHRQDFNLQLKQVISQKHLKHLDSVISKAKKNGGKSDLKKLKIGEDFERELDLAFTECQQRMVDLTESMPETLDIYSYRDQNIDNKETVSVSVANMAEYYLKSGYETVVEKKFDALMDSIKKSQYSTRDIINLTEFNIQNINSDSNGSSAVEIMAECASKLEKEKLKVNEKLQEYIDFADEQFDQAFEPLLSFRIEDSANEFIAGLRTYQGKKVLSRVSKIKDNLKNRWQNLIMKILYGRSEGILFTKKFGKQRDTLSTNSRLLDLVESVSPREVIIKSLPAYYTSLFNGKSNIGKEFWIHRPEEEASFKKAMTRYNQGFKGAVLVIGERNAGKTIFCKYAVQNYVRSDYTYSIFPPFHGTNDVQGFYDALKKATQMNGTGDQIISALANGSVLIINDLELFWERTAEGLEIINLLERLIDTYGQRILFVINVNPHTYKIINQLTDFSDGFIEIINLSPFDAKEIKELVLGRHRSSGLSIKYKSSEEEISDLQLAQLFNSYFNYSQGNPGTALNSWLAHITKVSEKGLLIEKPDTPPLSGLQELNEEWTMLLTQFVFHKRLTVEKIIRIISWDQMEIEKLLLALLRCGIIEERSTGVYHVNPYVHPFLVMALKEKEILR